MLGDSHTCALISDGSVRCWGLGTEGRLGHASTATIGDDEAAGTAPAVELGGKAVAIAAGYAHTCALLDTGRLRCWGRGKQGQLGHGRPDDVGDDETPASVGDVPVPERVLAVTAGGNATCALVGPDSIRCWGANEQGSLGYGTFHGRALGDDEPVETVPPISFPRAVKRLACSAGPCCVLLDDGSVRCWGSAVGSLDEVGVPANQATKVELGAPAVTVLMESNAHAACAVTSSGKARCWGHGRIGYPGNPAVGVHATSDDWGSPASLGDVPVPESFSQIAVGDDHACVVLTDGAVRCWGERRRGLIGTPPGDDVSIAEAVTVDLGAPAASVALSDFHSCALTRAGTVRCWGHGKDGRLGYGDTENIGEARTPAMVGDVPLGLTSSGNAR